MSNEEIFKELELILQKLSIEIKYRKGSFNGGICRYLDKMVLYLNSTHSVEKHIEVIISELKAIEIDLNTIKPELKKSFLNPELNSEVNHVKQ